MLVTVVVGSVFCVFTSAVMIYLLIRKCERRHNKKLRGGKPCAAGDEASHRQPQQQPTPAAAVRSSPKMEHLRQRTASVHSKVATMDKRRPQSTISEGQRGFPDSQNPDEHKPPMTREDAEFWLSLLNAASDQSGADIGPTNKMQKDILKVKPLI
jgi:hypothetical protein